MNKDIQHRFSLVVHALQELNNMVDNLRIGIEKERQETAWFDNGKVIVNGVSYPIHNFKIEWTKDENNS